MLSKFHRIARPLSTAVFVRLTTQHPAASYRPYSMSTSTQSTPTHLLQWTCSCGTANGLLTCTCKACGKEPPLEDAVVEDEAAEEQWVCFCGERNSADQETCTSCAKSPAEMAESVQVAEAEAPAETSTTETTKPVSDSWTCVCGAKNKSYRSECAVCGDAVDPVVQKALLDACIAAEKAPAPAAPAKPHPQEKDWQCPSCAYENYGSRLECRQCGRFKVGQSLGHEQGLIDWTCAKCSFSNFARRTTCYRCHNEKSLGDTKPVGSDFQVTSKDFIRRNLSSLDWQCTSCMYTNYASRVDCRRCSKRRPEEGSKASDARKVPEPTKQRTKDTSGFHSSSKQPTTKFTSRPSSNSQQGAKWPCVCGTMNLQHLSRCMQCHVKRPVAHLAPGDWVCQCGTLNFKARTLCFVCNAPGERQRFVVTDALSCSTWRCASCKSAKVQSASVFTCSECSAERPVTKDMINWQCAKCEWWNQTFRETCRSCSADKNEKANHGKSMSWKCPCGNVNQQSCSTCINCGKAKPARGNVQEVKFGEQSTTENKGSAHFGQKPNVLMQTAHQRPGAKFIKWAPPLTAEITPDKFWVCSCGEENFANAHACHACHHPKIAVSTWYCTECRTFNALRDKACERCTKPREVSTAKLNKLTPWKCKCGNENTAVDVLCRKCMFIRNCPHGQQMTVRAGDWRCKCELVNKKARARCLHCRTVRELIEWHCHCGHKNSVKTSSCEKCQSLPVSGQWRCSCGFFNYGTRVICHSCAKMRSGQDPLAQLVEGFDLSKDQAEGDNVRKAEAVRAQDEKTLSEAKIKKHDADCGEDSAKTPKKTSRKKKIRNDDKPLEGTVLTESKEAVSKAETTKISEEGPKKKDRAADGAKSVGTEESPSVEASEKTVSAEIEFPKVKSEGKKAKKSVVKKDGATPAKRATKKAKK